MFRGIVDVYCVSWYLCIKKIKTKQQPSRIMAMSFPIPTSDEFNLSLECFVDLSDARIVNSSQSQNEDTGGVFSDDTGFFSSPEDIGDSCLLRADLPESPTFVSDEDRYETLLKKYLQMKSSPSMSADKIDFDELLEVLTLTTKYSTLSMTAQILDLTLIIWGQQVTDCLTSTQALAADCIRHKKSVLATTNDSNSGRRGRSNSPMSTEDCQEDWGIDYTRKTSTNKNRQPRKSFVVDDSQISSTFADVVPDVVQRRKVLASKFCGLANGTLLDSEFNIHAFYQSEIATFADSSLQNSASTNVSPFWTWIQRAKQVPDLQHMFIPIYTPLLSDDSGSDIELDLQMRHTKSADEGKSLEGNATNVFVDSNDLLIENESENLVPDQDLENHFDLTEGGHIALNNESNERLGTSLKKDKDIRSHCRKRSSRVPLEQLNVAETEDHSIEAKRMRLDDSGISINDVDINIADPNCELESSVPFLTDPAADALTLENDPENLFRNVSGADFEIPTEICDNGASPKTSFNTRTPSRRINMNGLIDNFEKIVLKEIQDQNQCEEVAFHEVVRRAKIKVISGNSEENFISKDDTTVSAAAAFFACLQLAHSNSLYLVPTEDALFKFTTKAPPDPSPSSVINGEC